MSEQTVLILIQLGGLFVTALGIIGTGIWQLTRVESRLGEKIATHREEIDREIGLLRATFGETVASLRQKINDVELESYKTFVRRDSFYEVINKFEAAIGARMDKVETAFGGRMDKLELKIDRAFHGRTGSVESG